MLVENIKFTARANASQRIIAAGIVFALLYFASSIVLTLLLAVLIAYFLDPAVGLLERIHIPRAVGAVLVLLASTAILAGLGYFLLQRADDFAADWPRYSLVLRKGAAAVDRKLASVEKRVAEITPPEEEERTRPAVRIENSQSVREALLRGIGSLYSTLLVVTFLPFLIFFMLAAKRRLWLATLHLFPDAERPRVEQALSQVGVVLRGYMVGNALVALILVLASGLFFWMIHLDYPFLTGAVSGILNLVPYLGAMLSWAPPFLIGMAQWKLSIGPFLAVAGVLSFFHLTAINLLVPALVGRRVRLNALAVTIALMFWGWLWGAVGLILAIPITATIKVICDHADGWQPLGRFLGARDPARPKA